MLDINNTITTEYSDISTKTYYDDLSIKINKKQIAGYTADVRVANDFYPFGKIMPRGIDANNDGDYTDNGDQMLNINTNLYRFGFNEQEKDNEWNGVTGSKLDFGARIYDRRNISEWFPKLEKKEQIDNF